MFSSFEALLPHVCSLIALSESTWMLLKMQILWHVSILYQCLCELDLANLPPTQQIETPVVSITMKARIKVFFFFFFFFWLKSKKLEREKGRKKVQTTQQKSVGGPWPVIIPAGSKRRISWPSPCCCMAHLLNSSAEGWLETSNNPRKNFEIYIIGVPMDFK